MTKDRMVISITVYFNECYVLVVFISPPKNICWTHPFTERAHFLASPWRIHIASIATLELWGHY